MDKWTDFWQSISFGLWGFIIFCGYHILHFLRWFSTREIARFWEKVRLELTQQKSDLDTKITAVKTEIENNLEDRLARQDSVINAIKEDTASIRDYHHNKKVKEEGVMYLVLEALEKISNEKK